MRDTVPQKRCYAIYYPPGVSYKRSIDSRISDVIMLRIVSLLSVALVAGSLAGCAGLTLTPQQRAERQMGVPEYVQVQQRNAGRGTSSFGNQGTFR